MFICLVIISLIEHKHIIYIKSKSKLNILQILYHTNKSLPYKFFIPNIATNFLCYIGYIYISISLYILDDDTTFQNIRYCLGYNMIYFYLFCFVYNKTTSYHSYVYMLIKIKQPQFHLYEPIYINHAYIILQQILNLNDLK